jgi:hypothetical protein
VSPHEGIVGPGVFGLANAKGVDYVDQVFVSVVLAELVAFLGLDEAFKDAAQNIGADCFKIEGAKVLKHGAPGALGVLVAEDVGARPILLGRVEKCFVVAGGVDGELKGFLETDVEIVGGSGSLWNVKFFEFVEFRAEGFVKQEPIGKDIAQSTGGAVT